MKLSKSMNSDSLFPLEEIAVKRIDGHPDRPTIIFLHDSLGCIDLWRDFPEKLGDLTRCNVLIYDRQGYGKSCPFSYLQRGNDYMELEADLLHALLDLWGIQHPILFGHSDGGSIALIAGGKYPERIHGIITEGAHIFVEDITIEGIRDAVKLYETTDLKSKLEKYHGDKTEEMFWAWASTWTTAEFRSWNIQKFLPSSKCPSLIIQGADDEYGTLRQVEAIVDGVKGYAESWIIPAVKHTPHREVPAAVLEKTARFIAESIDKGK